TRPIGRSARASCRRRRAPPPSATVWTRWLAISPRSTSAWHARRHERAELEPALRAPALVCAPICEGVRAGGPRHGRSRRYGAALPGDDQAAPRPRLRPAGTERAADPLRRRDRRHLPRARHPHLHLVVLHELGL